mmetsp:Transcript_5373/g.11098  ORF Transcript_5373/g.11098 Transcript_5373/m.11098 type:complete len:111 (-) Transcript_5373:703-1035(-)
MLFYCPAAYNRETDRQPLFTTSGYRSAPAAGGLFFYLLFSPLSSSVLSTPKLRRLVSGAQRTASSRDDDLQLQQPWSVRGLRMRELVLLLPQVSSPKRACQLPSNPGRVQ